MKKSLFAACIVLPACFTLVLVACTNNAPVQPVKDVGLRPVHVTAPFPPTLIVAGILKPAGIAATRISLAVAFGVSVLVVAVITPGEVAMGGRAAPIVDRAKLLADAHFVLRLERR